MRSHEESRIQQACVRWFRLQYPRLARLLIAVPNGGGRSKVEAAIMKGEGVTAGASDLLLLVPSGGCPYLCVDIVEPWFELHGCATPDGQFTGTHINRDSLLIVETVQYKRWLGFLWKTKKIKNRQIDVVSKNPATKILGVEFVTIEK